MGSAHKNWLEIFEVVSGIPFLAVIALQLAVPLSFPRGFITPAVILGGAALITMGAAFVLGGRRELVQHGQPIDPGRTTNRIGTTGVYSVSRNPPYLGGVCFPVGIALVLGLPWVLVLLLPALVACHYVLIAPEEKYLAALFGEEYRRYAASAYRWFGRARRPR
jgi:protein-S-isoprenylcysteine O-methyltransferase Ste14